MQKETFERYIIYSFIHSFIQFVRSFVRSFIRLVCIYKCFHYWIFFKGIIHPDLKMYHYLLTSWHF